MPSKLKAWLKAKLGFRGPVPYKTLAEEEVEVEPVITYNCAYCDYRSPTQKGLRCHRITVHRIGVGVSGCLDLTFGHISRCLDTSSVPTALHFSGCLDYKFGHISHSLDTIKCTSSAALQWLFGLQVQPHHSLPGHHQLHLQRCTSVAVWTTSLVISVTPWTPSSVLPALLFSGYLGYKYSRITRCLDTINCIYSAALQWLFGLQVWSYQSLPGHHQVYFQRCSSVVIWATSTAASLAAWTPSTAFTALHFSGCLDYKFSHISRCLDTIKGTYSAALQWLFGLQVQPHHSLPGHHQLHLQRCTSVAVWTTSLVTSVAAWTPSRVLTALLFSGYLGYKYSRITRCLDTINCIYSAALQWLFGLQVWSYQSLPGHHQVYFQRCSSVVIWATSTAASLAAWTPSTAFTALHFSGCLDYKFSHISRCLDTIKGTYSTALQCLFGLQVKSHQSIPGHHQVYLERCSSVAVLTTSLVTSLLNSVNSNRNKGKIFKLKL
ncbi:hypothetical protein TNCT_513821 [Trichonephila clavata]|uniref:Uncharacterized protein n=1 Tax=Trichonephila clavata TaxID=2740835 RepID=A0A8X6M624_TRICU|nr:hypothetical protein TNCT_513821 [Trichonephila clavata]